MFRRAGTPLDFKRVRSDSFAVRALSSVYVIPVALAPPY
jgi:hypothetical protein